MVVMIQEKYSIGNEHHVSRTSRNGSIVSPTCSNDREKEKSVSMASLSPQSVFFSVPYDNSRSDFINNNIVGCNALSEKSTKKSVRFMMDPCDSQKHFCRTISTRTILTQVEKKNQWYTSSEIKHMRSETYNEALAARATAASYLQLFKRLHSVCNDSASDLNSEMHLAQGVAASQYRGAESLTFVETVRLQQRQNLREILAAQEDFRDLLSEDELMMELQSLSQKVSRCSSRLAYMLGLGDADEARQITTPQDRKWALQLNDQVKDQSIQREDESPRQFRTQSDSTRYEI